MGRANISYANARKRISQARAILRERYREYRGVRESAPPTTGKDDATKNLGFGCSVTQATATTTITGTSSSIVRYPVAPEVLNLISVFPQKKPGISTGTLEPFVLPWRVWADSGGDGFFSPRTRRLSGCDRGNCKK